jgi:broad specificity phosphatase PhoE
VPTVLLIRHGQGSYGTGDYDVLSDMGKRQAEVVAAALERRGVRPVRIVAGTLARQTDTAAPTVAATGVQPATDPRWNEYEMEDVVAHHGEGDEMPAGSRELQPILDAALKRWIAARGDTPVARSWSDFAGGAIAALDELTASLGRGETALAFTSGGILGVLCAHLLDLPDPAAVAFNRVAVNGAITKFVHGRSGTTLISYNDHGHLEDADRELVTFR